MPEMAAFFRKMLPRGLGFLDRLLADGRRFVAGDRPTMADCTLRAAFHFGCFGKIEIDPSFGHLTRWDGEYRERPSAKELLSL